MNVKALKQIQHQILEVPGRVNMDFWVRQGKPGSKLRQGRPLGLVGDDPIEQELTLPPCGTAGCIAGWYAELNLPKSEKARQRARDKFVQEQEGWGFEYEAYARLGLGLTDFQARRLFYPLEWPADLKLELDKHKYGSRAYARVVSKRISRFIKTDGAE